MLAGSAIIERLISLFAGKNDVYMSIVLVYIC